MYIHMYCWSHLGMLISRICVRMGNTQELSMWKVQNLSTEYCTSQLDGFVMPRGLMACYLLFANLAYAMAMCSLFCVLRELCTNNMCSDLCTLL